MSSSFQHLENEDQGSAPASSTPSEPPAKVAGKVATYFKQNSEIVKGATKLVEAIAPNRPTYLPDTFEVFIGGVAGDSYKLLLDGDSLTYVAYGEDYVEREVVQVDVSEQRWNDFWAELDQLGTWDWQPDYGDRRSDDSTLFSLSISHAGQAIQSAGCDAFPPDGLPLEQSENFAKFCSAVSKLVGWLAFR